MNEEQMVLTGYEWIERQIQQDFPELTTGNYLLVIKLYNAYYDEELEITVGFSVDNEQGIYLWEYEWWGGEECSLVGLIPIRFISADEVRDLSGFRLRD